MALSKAHVVLQKIRKTLIVACLDLKLIVYPRESSGSGAYSIARTKDGGGQSVVWDYESQKWIECSLPVGTIMASGMTLYEKDLRRLGLGYIIDEKIKFQDGQDDEDKKEDNN